MKDWLSIDHPLSLSLITRNTFIFDIRFDLFSIIVYHFHTDLYPLIRSMNIFKRGKYP